MEMILTGRVPLQFKFANDVQEQAKGCWVGGRKRGGRVVSEGQFGGLFLNPSPLVVLPGMSLLFGSSRLSVSAVRVVWGGDWVRQAGKEQGARSLWKEAGEGGSPIKVRC